ncbi:MAG TPA: L,D-transpeptidase [Pseudonocardiaceae bacterium]|jgi:lipoprotein-anchoring transpeptidase ErfK/SrfK|nr:L,D-transpeptidase [Pseudonocardiaceae bacterium]
MRAATTRLRTQRVILAIPTIAAAVVLVACSSEAHASDRTSGAVTAASHTSAAGPTTTSPSATSSATTSATSTAPTSSATPTAPKPAAPQAPAASNPCGITNGACVTLSGRRAWIVRGGQVIYQAPIMPGSRSYPTPTGTFHVLYQQVKHISKEFHDAPMPYSTFFYPGDAFHVGSLGVYSHGCIHMSWAGAETFFHDLHVGDEVKIIR